MELIEKAQIYGADDPNFVIMYVRQDGSADDFGFPGGSGTTSGGNPLKCSAIVSPGRDQNGVATSTFWVYFYLLLFSLPYIFSWGLRGFVDFLKTAHYEMFRCNLYGELADHLGVKMTDCYQLEYLASTVGELGKGYGSQLIKVGVS